MFHVERPAEMRTHSIGQTANRNGEPLIYMLLSPRISSHLLSHHLTLYIIYTIYIISLTSHSISHIFPSLIPYPLPILPYPFPSLSPLFFLTTSPTPSHNPSQSIPIPFPHNCPPHPITRPVIPCTALYPVSLYYSILCSTISNLIPQHIVSLFIHFNIHIILSHFQFHIIYSYSLLHIVFYTICPPIPTIFRIFSLFHAHISQFLNPFHGITPCDTIAQIPNELYGLKHV